MGFQKESLEQLNDCVLAISGCPVSMPRLREFAPEAESNLEMNVSPNPVHRHPFGIVS